MLEGFTLALDSEIKFCVTLNRIGTLLFGVPDVNEFSLWSGNLLSEFFQARSLSDFGNRSEKAFKFRLFLFGFEANIEIFNENLGKNGQILDNISTIFLNAFYGLDL